jgi:hypothetical protein
MPARSPLSPAPSTLTGPSPPPPSLTSRLRPFDKVMPSSLETATDRGLGFQSRQLPELTRCYTVRNTSDAHFGAGSAHGDDQFEMGGFIVHFFGLELIERLADGFKILELADFEEGRLPRRLSAVTMARI